jgi:uncharacterized linocin/CFP29 family protein
MADGNMQLQWTDDQWNRVRQVVYEEARRARVAGSFLPLYGPLAPDARFVSAETVIRSDTGTKGISVRDTDTLKLSTLQVKVYLRGAQVADPELASALSAFRHAANVLARLEDDIIFNGQAREGEGPKPAGRPEAPAGPWEVTGGQETDGLLPEPPAAGAAPGTASGSASETSPDIGEQLVSSVSRAIGTLEKKHQLGPFACVLDQDYFMAVQTPQASSLVLPQDRILPFLGGGPLVRSSTLRPKSGLVIALGGAPIDLVVGTDISVGFLQVTAEPQFVFRVYEKIVLRIKQQDAIAPLSFDLKP